MERSVWYLEGYNDGVNHLQPPPEWVFPNEKAKKDYQDGYIDGLEFRQKGYKP